MKGNKHMKTITKFIYPVFALACFALSPTAQAQMPTCVEPPSGMVGWWPGDGNANDIQDGNNGTLGNASFATGEVDRGFIFVCEEQGVVIPHNNTLNVSSPGFTADFWMQGIKNQPQSIAAVFEKSHGFVDNTGWAFQIGTSTGILGINIGDVTVQPCPQAPSDLLHMTLRNEASDAVMEMRLAPID